MENKIQKLNELFADYIENNLELIQDVTELLKRYPEYAERLKEFNGQFPLGKETIDDRGTLKYDKAPELIAEEPAVENVNQIKKLSEI